MTKGYVVTDSGVSYSNVRHASNVVEAELITVIRVKSRVGRGTDDDPVRIITEYWDTDGVMLAREDLWEAPDDQP